MDILDVYRKCSGQQINRNKTTIFFSKSTKVESREQIKLALGVPEIIQYEKYLGLPSLVGRKKKKQVSITLRKGCGKNCRGGRKNLSHKLEGRF